MQNMTINEIADVLGIQQTPDQPLAPADVIAGFDDSLTGAYGTLTGDTVIGAEDAAAIIEAWQSTNY